MKTERRGLVCGVIGVMLLAGQSWGGVSVQPGGGTWPRARELAYPVVPPEHRNAALIYGKVWIMVPGDHLQAARDVDFAALGDEIDPERLPQSFKDVRAKFPSGDAVGFMLKAAATDRCDFELPIEDGPGTLMPHLGKMRQTASALRVVARGGLSSGDTAGAAAACAGMLGVARHLSQEPILISALVSNAVARMAIDEIRVGLKHGRWTAADKQTLLAALDRLDPTDPLGVRRAFVGERDVFVAWAERNMTPNSDLSWVTDFGLGAEDEAKVRALAQSGGAAAEFARLREVYNTVIDAWESPDTESTLARISEDVKAMKAGVLHKLFMADLVKPYRTDREFRGVLEAVRRELSA